MVEDDELPADVTSVSLRRHVPGVELRAGRKRCHGNPSELSATILRSAVHERPLHAARGKPGDVPLNVHGMRCLLL